MAISAGKSAPILHLIRKSTKSMRCTINSVAAAAQVSTETLDLLVGLCAGQGASLRIQRKKLAKLFRRLSASQTDPPIVDLAEDWAAEVGGSITGEIKGHRSYLKPWLQPNFGITFKYRRAIDDVPSSIQSPIYDNSLHDGSLFGALVRSKKSTPSCRPAACKVNSYPTLSVSSTIKPAPFLTPPDSSPSKQTSNFASSMASSRASPPITPPISPRAGRSFRPRYDSLDKQISHREQFDAQSIKVPHIHSGIISFLVTRVKERLLKVRNGASPNHWNANRHESSRATRGTAETEGEAESDDDGIGSFEVRAMRAQQSRRLAAKQFLPPLVGPRRKR